MSYFHIYVLDAFAFVLLLFIRTSDNWAVQRRLFSTQLFLLLVDINMVMLVVDPLAWAFNGPTHELSIELNWLFNMLLYIFAIIPVVLLLLYTDFLIHADHDRVRRILLWASIPVLANTVLTVLSMKYGFYFSIDAANTYHRGPLFPVHVVLCYEFLVATAIMTFKNRKKIEPRHYRALLMYPLPILAASVLQIVFFGMSLIWPCMALAVFTVYFNIQNAGLYTDYLTGVSNRLMLDLYLKERIRGNSTFSAILTDMDRFKQINDIHGHHVGDTVLNEAVRLLQDSVGGEGLIVRYGGDEFFIVMDIGDRDRLEGIVARIRQTVSDFNTSSDRPYTIMFSMGYDVYSPASGMDANDFLRHIDALMYRNKQAAAACQPPLASLPRPSKVAAEKTIYKTDGM